MNKFNKHKGELLTLSEVICGYLELSEGVCFVEKYLNKFL